MLKIKDNIDFKELEKFGFKYDEMSSCWYKNFKGNINKFFIPTKDTINLHKGQISFYNGSKFCTTIYLETLDDLIEAGMIENTKKN